MVEKVCELRESMTKLGKYCEMGTGPRCDGMTRSRYELGGNNAKG